MRNLNRPCLFVYTYYNTIAGLASFMADRNSNNAIPKLSPALMLVTGIVLTAILVLGIKYYISDDEQAPAAPAAVKEDKIFKDETEKAPGYNPAYRPEAASGDSLGIFTKTNTGYAKEESSAPARGGATGRDIKTKGVKPGHKAAKKAGAATVIPRMQAPKAFGSSSPSQTAPNGAGMPDISALMKQAQQKTGQ